jgi:hypothetical protein
MSWYVSGSKLVESTGEQEWWTKVYGPSQKVPVSGIYRCIGCGREVTSNEGDPFPPQNHHQHNALQGDIRWKLNVRTNTEGK